jgi:hypothetical protein
VSDQMMTSHIIKASTLPKYPTAPKYPTINEINTATTPIEIETQTRSTFY